MGSLVVLSSFSAGAGSVNLTSNGKDIIDINFDNELVKIFDKNGVLNLQTSSLGYFPIGCAFNKKDLFITSFATANLRQYNKDFDVLKFFPIGAITWFITNCDDYKFFATAAVGTLNYQTRDNSTPLSSFDIGLNLLCIIPYGKDIFVYSSTMGQFAFIRYDGTILDTGSFAAGSVLGGYFDGLNIWLDELTADMVYQFRYIP